MNNVFFFLAAEGGEELPMEGGNNLLLPKGYDIFWSLVAFVIILLVFWKFVLPNFQELLRVSRPRQRQRWRSTTPSLPMPALKPPRSASRHASVASRSRQKLEHRPRKRHSASSPPARSSWPLPALRWSATCATTLDRTPSTWQRSCWVASCPIPRSSRRRSTTSCPSSTTWHRPESRDL